MRLRRTIGLKKDEYHLDRKHITCAKALMPQRLALLLTCVMDCGAKAPHENWLRCQTSMPLSVR